MPDFFHRVEVRDLTGHCNSVLFSPEQGLDYASLRRGATLFVRYAAKAYFSDLMTQVRRWAPAAAAELLMGLTHYADLYDGSCQAGLVHCRVALLCSVALSEF